MTPERWKRIDELYHQAQTRPMGQRSEFLEEACGVDGELRLEIETLLNEPAADDGFLEAPALLLTASQVSAIGRATMTGRTLGRYHLQTLLGTGGMGEVYRARDTTLDRDVAIKILPRELSSNPDRLARLEREARMLAALNHPNVCAIHGLEQSNQIRFLVLELVEGETLTEALAAVARRQARASGLPLRETLSIASQIARALEATHEKGLVHRDLKPANIKITPDGTVKVLDFGLAKEAVSDISSPSLTHGPAERDGPIRIGTPAYMSPEQARGAEVDKRADIWAFGCVLYQLLTGCVPFSGATISDTIAKVLEREPDWSALPPLTPAPVRRVLRRCLTKDAKQRLRDIGDARIELECVDDDRSGASEAGFANRSPLKTAVISLPWLGLAALLAAFVVREPGRRAEILENPLANARFSTFTDWEGTEAGAEISPDGRFVVFVADRAGEFDLWLSQVGTSRFVNLTEDIPPLSAPGALLRSFGFTGDGSEIWFSSGGDPGAGKLLVPLTGGRPRAFLGQGASTPAWAPDATRMVYETIAVDSGDPLFVADGMGADARQIYVGNKDTHNHNPLWSPDGRWIYFVHGTDPSEQMDIWRIDPSGGAPEQITRHGAAIKFLAALAPPTLLYLADAEDRSGPWLWALDVERKVTRRIVSGVETFTSISASRDGQRAVSTAAKHSAGLWRVPLLDALAQESDVERYPMPAIRSLAPRFGGASLFYLSGQGTGDGLWRLQDGRAAEVWKSVDAALSEPAAVSRDGSRLAIVVRREGRRRLVMMSADGTDSRTLAPSIDVKGEPGQGTADWSPDGQWIVTGGTDAEGPGLFKIAVDGSATIRLVGGHALNPIWSPDADLIVYSGPFSAGQVTLRAVRPDGLAAAFPELRVRPGGYRFSPDGATLVYLPTLRSLDFWRVDVATQERRQLTRLSDRGKLVTFDITRDGKHIVFDRSRESSDIVLIDLPK